MYLLVKVAILSSENLCSNRCRSETGIELTCRVLDPGSLTVILMRCLSLLETVPALKQGNLKASLAVRSVPIKNSFCSTSNIDQNESLSSNKVCIPQSKWNKMPTHSVNVTNWTVFAVSVTPTHGFVSLPVLSKPKGLVSFKLGMAIEQCGKSAVVLIATVDDELYLFGK